MVILKGREKGAGGAARARRGGYDPAVSLDSITCPQCGLTSHHPDDVRYRYCGHCKTYLDGSHFMGTSPQAKQLAQLFYSWEELDVLAGLVEGALAASGPNLWPMLNSLHTSLREAQNGLRRVKGS